MKRLSFKILIAVFSLFFIQCSSDDSQQLHAQAGTTDPSSFTSPDPEPSPAPPDNTSSKKIKIALLLDTSNSMDGLIEQAKSQLWKIVNELASANCEDGKPSLQIALYEYGNDRLVASEGYIRQVSALTDDLDKVSQDLFALTTNGGAEYCGHVIQTATNQLEWVINDDDLQVIFIAGNEPFTQGSVSFTDACQKAKKKNIAVNTIYCGPFDAGVSSSWKAGADLADGSYMSIEQDRKTVYIPSPYDDKITALNTKLNDTYIWYGSTGKSKKENQMRQDINAEKYGKQNSVSRIQSKNSHFYKNSSWDLVDAKKENKVDISKLKDEDLPKEFKGKSVEEKKALVDKKAKERALINQQIAELSKKRTEYVAVEKKKRSSGDENMLDAAMINAIKKHAKSRGFSFNEEG